MGTLLEYKLLIHMGYIRMKTFLLSMIAMIFAATVSFADKQTYAVNIKDGEVIKGEEVLVIFGLKGMGVAPAGVEYENTGHHHILLDREPWGQGPDDKDMMEYGIISDAHNIHYGKGQTQTTLKLAPGKHTIQLLLGDLNHIPIKGMESAYITITVE